jgi:hypothetical protein
MHIGGISINPIRRKFAAGVLLLASFACAGFLLKDEKLKGLSGQQAPALI